MNVILFVCVLYLTPRSAIEADEENGLGVTERK